MRGPTIGIAAVLAFACLLPVEACVDATSLGPYTRWFNERMLARATSAALVGQPEANVELVLGPASDVYSYRSTGQTADGGLEEFAVRTFDYYPYPLAPVSKFQVHCREGVVTAFEMFDD